MVYWVSRLLQTANLYGFCTVLLVIADLSELVFHPARQMIVRGSLSLLAAGPFLVSSLFSLKLGIHSSPLPL
jgi:hypothetical protein